MCSCENVSRVVKDGTSTVRIANQDNAVEFIVVRAESCDSSRSSDADYGRDAVFQLQEFKVPNLC